MRKTLALPLMGLAALLVICLSHVVGANAQTAPIQYSVRRIIDGDTYEVNATDSSGKYIHIRLGCVDTPETYYTYKNKPGYANQSYWGSLATNRVSQLINQSGGVIWFTPSSSSYERTVGQVHLTNGVSIQETLAWEGLGMIDPRYVENCSSTTQQYQYYAQWYKWGIWSDPYFLPPWVFRNQS
jgi:endonuclease YncB( thermonuclease family)